MSQTTTFGRRGAAAPAPARPEYRPAPGEYRPPPEKTFALPAAPRLGKDSVVGYFVWLLFSFDGRLNITLYRYTRIFANLLCLGLYTALWPTLRASPDDAGAQLLVALAMIVTAVFMVWTTLAMQVKRRHDRDKSWPWLFVGFIPIIGPCWVLIETCWLKGTPGHNRFDDPATAAAA
jgi:uncharacterized membrane protein YhaH (DUF805 family)